jgi:hypothetical protein
MSRSSERGVERSSHADSAPGSRITGIRSCREAIAGLAAVVRIVQVRSVPPSSACQTDHSPANANTWWSLRVM